MRIAEIVTNENFSRVSTPTSAPRSLYIGGDQHEAWGKTVAAETRRWLKSLREPEVRDLCREQFAEWVEAESSEEAESFRSAYQLWRNVLGEAKKWWAEFMKRRFGVGV